MTSDPTIREQGYQYFLQEAPELLQVIEQGLLTLREDSSINKINNLMRATHTLKGAAASIGLTTIATVAHSLEDIFKALCRPDISIAPDVEALLFEGFECLRLPLKAEITGGVTNHTEVLDRTAAIFAQLQEKLGDCFGQEAYLPTSAELGFDVTQSIFEVGVAQRLDQIAAAVASEDPEAIRTVLQTQSEVFLGLAESLNLPGFGTIAQTVLTAIDQHPERVVPLARLALADFRSGQEAVLAGDRTEGGQVSPALQNFANGTDRSLAGGVRVKSTAIVASTTHSTQATQPAKGDKPLFHWVRGFFGFGAGEKSGQVHPAAFSTVEVVASSEPEPDRQEAESELILPEELPHPLLENIWGGPAGEDLVLPEAREELTTAIAPSNGDLKLRNPALHPASDPAATLPTPQPLIPTPTAPQKAPAPLSPSIRVEVEHLEHLNYSVGELLTNQNRQTLQTEQIQAAVRTLYLRLQQHQQLLSQLQDAAERRTKKRKGKRKARNAAKPSHATVRLPSDSQRPGVNRPSFDTLATEADREAQSLIQSLTNNTVQLFEAVDAIDLFTRQSSQTLEKQGRLLTGARDALIEARMLPLSYILDRFPRLLQQLETLHNKPVALELRGSEVMVDKAVVEKLYDPLLHLIRNAFDHGIEPVELRRQRGKPEQGQIQISAHNQGRRLVIEVRDDGRGLDFEQIRQRAIERQVLPRSQAMSLSQAQLIDLLFEPGFSTAAQVNDLSGRGIGLDVVQSQLQALQGAVTVHSEPQQGTTFRLQIPLNLTIARLFLCKAGSKTYALLDDAIEQIVLPQAEQLQSRNRCRVLRWRQDGEETLIPIHSLTSALTYHSPIFQSSVSQTSPLFPLREAANPIVLLRHQDSVLGLEVDQLLGEQELVIRPLKTLAGLPGYVQGASILADGQLALVLDGAALLQKTIEPSASRAAATSWTGLALSPEAPQTSLPPAETAFPALPIATLETRAAQKILIVEDSITARQTLALTLQKAGYQVSQAEDGYEALERFRQQSTVQLVICDLEMPRMSGFEFLRNRQQIPALAEIPVMILSSRNDKYHRSLAAQLGATAYMTKPYMEYKLLGIVTELLERTT